MFGINHFGWVDYITVTLTLLFSLGIGVFYGFCQKQTKEEMLVGGRNMKIFPVAISMFVTYFSAVAILGSPAEVYAYGSQFFFVNILMFVFVPLSTIIFVKVFYEMKLTSIYEYLELRFDSVWVRWLTSFTFILQILLINAITLFAPAIALEAILGMPVWLSVVGIGVIGAVYTSIGGIKAVVWTDVFQFFMIIIGMGAIVTRGFIKAGGVVKAFEKAGERGRLEIIKKLDDFSATLWFCSFSASLTFDPFMRHNSWNFIFGMGFTILSLYGTHQPLVQRYCSLPSTTAAVKTLLWTLPLSCVVYSTTMITGISAIATYAGCDPILLGQIYRPDAIIPHFVLDELAFLPGMMGIFVSCIFSAVLSSISSTLNSLAAVTWEDFLAKFSYFKNMAPEKQTQWTKLISAIYGALSIVLAFGAQNLGTLFQVVMTAVGATSGPLGGIFLCGLFLPFMNRPGAIVGILFGLCSMMFLAIKSFSLAMTVDLYPRLPTDLTECPPDTDYSKAINYTFTDPPEFDYPTKIYTLSYLLYPLVGAVITVTVGVIVSLLSGGCTKSQRIPKKYVHPWIKDLKCVQRFVIDEPVNYGRSSTFKRESSKYDDPQKYDDYKYELVAKCENCGHVNSSNNNSKM